MELYHYGVKGMKWGVRRFQNEDGSLPNEGRRHYGYLKSNKDVNDIVRSMSVEDRKLLMDEDYDKDYISTSETQKLAKRIIKKNDNTPVAFLDIYDGSDDWKYITVGTRAGEQYRGKGYAKQCAIEGKQWLDDNWDTFSQNKVYWSARSDNVASNKLAKDLGFTKETSGNEWNIYSYNGPK